jgi:hypothetical protein
LNKFGEVGEGVVAGALHAAKFFLLLDGQLGLSALGPSLVSSETECFGMRGRIGSNVTFGYQAVVPARESSRLHNQVEVAESGGQVQLS